MNPRMVDYIEALENVKPHAEKILKTKIDKDMEVLAISLVESFENGVGAYNGTKDDLKRIMGYAISIAHLFQKSESAEDFIGKMVRYDMILRRKAKPQGVKR